MKQHQYVIWGIIEILEGLVMVISLGIIKPTWASNYMLNCLIDDENK